MPNKENIRLWVDALRSGEYQQGTHYLAKEGVGGSGTLRYCCLGVACEVAIKNGVEVRRDQIGRRIHFDHSGAMLPASVSIWLGFEGYDNIDLGNRVDAVLANDTHGWTFERIADALERKYLSDDTANPAE